MISSKYLYLTDVHLKESNANLILEMFSEAICICKELGVDTIVHGGDLLDSRKSMHFNVIQTLLSIEDMLEDSGVKMVTIVGNHDKINYLSSRSWLDIFRNSPSIDVISTVKSVPELNLIGVSFFDESSKECSKYLNEAIKMAKKSKTPVDLIWHGAMSEVRNNDGTVIDNSIKKGDFKEFRSVLIGHYHDYQKIGDNVWYAGATRQNNFGEDPDKGYVIVDHQTGEFRRHRFTCTPSYETVKLDLEDYDGPNDVMDAFKEASKGFPESSKVRLVAVGSEKVKSKIPKGELKGLGVKVKHDRTSSEDVDVSFATIEEFEVMDNKAIIEEWDGYKGKVKDVTKKVIKIADSKLKSVSANG